MNLCYSTSGELRNERSNSQTHRSTTALGKNEFNIDSVSSGTFVVCSMHFSDRVDVCARVLVCVSAREIEREKVGWCSAASITIKISFASRPRRLSRIHHRCAGWHTPHTTAAASFHMLNAIPCCVFMSFCVQCRAQHKFSTWFMERRRIRVQIYLFFSFAFSLTRLLSSVVHSFANSLIDRSTLTFQDYQTLMWCGYGVLCALFCHFPFLYFVDVCSCLLFLSSLFLLFLLLLWLCSCVHSQHSTFSSSKVTLIGIVVCLCVHCRRRSEISHLQYGWWSWIWIGASTILCSRSCMRIGTFASAGNRLSWLQTRKHSTRRPWPCANIWFRISCWNSRRRNGSGTCRHCWYVSVDCRVFHLLSFTELTNAADDGTCSNLRLHDSIRYTTHKQRFAIIFIIFTFTIIHFMTFSYVQRWAQNASNVHLLLSERRWSTKAIKAIKHISALCV